MLSLSFSRALSPPRARLYSLVLCLLLARSLFSLFLLSVTGRSLISSPFLSLFLAPLSVQSVTLLPRSLPADRLTLFHGRRRSLLRPLARVRSTRSLFQAWFPWSGANVHHVHRGIPLVSPTFGLHSPLLPSRYAPLHSRCTQVRIQDALLLPFFSLSLSRRYDAFCRLQSTPCARERPQKGRGRVSGI